MSIWIYVAIYLAIGVLLAWFFSKAFKNMKQEDEEFFDLRFFFTDLNDWMKDGHPERFGLLKKAGICTNLGCWSRHHELSGSRTDKLYDQLEQVFTREFKDGTLPFNDNYCHFLEELGGDKTWENPHRVSFVLKAANGLIKGI